MVDINNAGGTRTVYFFQTQLKLTVIHQTLPLSPPLEGSGNQTNMAIILREVNKLRLLAA